MTDHNQPPVDPTIPKMSEVNDLKPMKTSGFAVASFALGIAALATCGLTTPLGLIFGIISIIQIKTKKVSNLNRFYAISGITINAIIMAALAIYISMWQASMFMTDDDKQHLCASNLKQIGTTLQMYMSENDQCLPPSDKWIDLLSPYRKSDQILKCPSESKAKIGYAMNNGASGIAERQMRDTSLVVVLFDSIQKDSPHGGTELLPLPERHILLHEYDSE
ncbi:MAG: hypothetical protein ACYC0V_10300 [Armatimonadota bacterium]